jgi:hypothetical protein
LGLSSIQQVHVGCTGEHCTHFNGSCLSLSSIYARNRPGVAQTVPGGLGSQISWHLTHEGGEVVSLTHRLPLPPGMFLVFIFTRGCIDPRAMERLEGDMSLKNPVTTGNRSWHLPTSNAVP